MDYLSSLPVEIFIQNITYLPFSDVINVCSSNKKLYNYCIDKKYNTQWKSLIDNTYSSIYDYEGKLKNLWTKLGLNERTYNYIVYVKLIDILDPVTQATIYYRQGDMENFERFKQDVKYLTLFLLGNRDFKKYYDGIVSSSITYNRLLDGDKIIHYKLTEMLLDMIKVGSVNGIKYLMGKGAKIDDYVFRHVLLYAKKNIDMVKFVVENTDHELPNYILNASILGDLDSVKYLTDKGFDIHINDDEALMLAIKYKHVNIAKFLKEHGAIERSPKKIVMDGISLPGDF